VEITDIAWARTSATLYGISYGALYAIDTATCEATPIGDGLHTSNANALTCDASGNLFGATVSGYLLRVDPFSGGAATIGSYGSGLTSSGDLAFASDGTLFGSANAPGEVGDVLVRIDPSNGIATRVGSTGYQDVFGLVFVGDKLYGVTAANELVRLDTQTGEGVLVRDLSFSAWGAESAGD